MYMYTNNPSNLRLLLLLLLLHTLSSVPFYSLANGASVLASSSIYFLGSWGSWSIGSSVNLILQSYISCSSSSVISPIFSSCTLNLIKSFLLSAISPQFLNLCWSTSCRAILVLRAWPPGYMIMPESRTLPFLHVIYTDVGIPSG